MLLNVQQIVKGYREQPVLRNVSFEVAAGEIVCLLGPSGCGKSTLLRVIAGLEGDYSGTVRFENVAIDRVPVHQRGFGFMFQEYALLPHRGVAQNIAFGLRMQHLPRAAIEQRVQAMLELVGLPGYESRSIFELSGGERQRVALARSLAPEPRLLMLDEPLGALDRTLRERLTEELREIIKRVGLTSLYVTHDQVEAFAVADRILLMNEGKIVQSGTPAEVYQQPATVFAARFLGLNNLLAGRIEDRNADGEIFVQTAIGRLRVSNTTTTANGAAIVLIRPEAATLLTPSNTENVIEGEVVRSTFRGSTQRILLRHTSGTELELDVAAEHVREHDTVRLALRADRLALLAEE